MHKVIQSELLQPLDLSSLPDMRSIAYSGECLYIILYTKLLSPKMLLPLRFGWLLVLRLYKDDYLQFFKCVCPFDYASLAASIGWYPVNRFNHTSWLSVVTPTDRSTSVRLRCVLKFLVAFLCCHFARRAFFCCCKGICLRTESDFFLFLINRSMNKEVLKYILLHFYKYICNSNNCCLHVISQCVSSFLGRYGWYL